MDRGRLDYFKKLILEERDRLIEDVSSYGRDFRDMGPKASEYGENASLSEKKEFLTNLVDLESGEIKGINDAPKRIAKGTYGICLKCGSDIPDERLEALPMTEMCVRCKRLEEDRSLGRALHRSPWRLAIAVRGPARTSWDEEDDEHDLI